MIERFDPPGFLTDFGGIPGQLDQWSAAVSGWFDGSIAALAETLAEGDQPQFYNETRTDLYGPVFDQIIGWKRVPVLSATGGVGPWPSGWPTTRCR